MFSDIMKSIWALMVAPMSYLRISTYESSWLIALLSCIMAMVVLVNVRSAGIIIHDVFPVHQRSENPSYQAPPINIERISEVQMTEAGHLQWQCYNRLPPAIMLENNGNTVVMRISSTGDSTPHIVFGALATKYYFVEAIFKWSYSEHMINSRRYAFEMQVLHAANAPFSAKYLTVSYLYVSSLMKNDGMDQIVDNLNAIVTAGSVIELPPFDLISMIYPFTTNYYSYYGTYTNGTIELPTKWIICTRDFGIGQTQLTKFANLHRFSGERIRTNARTPQPQGDLVVELNS